MASAWRKALDEARKAQAAPEPKPVPKKAVQKGSDAPRKAAK